jgi:phosphoglycolate phosphatase
MDKQTKPYLLFDFDGTLADSLSLGLCIVNDLSDHFGYHPVTPEEMEILRGQSLTAVFKRLHLPIYKLPFFVHNVKAELTKRLSELKPFAGIPEVLDELKAKDIPMALLTSNSINNVLPFLKKYGMNVFDWFEVDVGLFNKSHALAKQLKRKEISTCKPIYIGDEVRDIKAAKHTHLPIISVTWGFQPRSLLEKLHPEYLVDTPLELLEVIRKLPEA